MVYLHVTGVVWVALLLYVARRGCRTVRVDVPRNIGLARGVSRFGRRYYAGILAWNSTCALGPLASLGNSSGSAGVTGAILPWVAPGWRVTG